MLAEEQAWIDLGTDVDPGNNTLAASVFALDLEQGSDSLHAYYAHGTTLNGHAYTGALTGPVSLAPNGGSLPKLVEGKGY